MNYLYSNDKNVTSQRTDASAVSGMTKTVSQEVFNMVPDEESFTVTSISTTTMQSNKILDNSGNHDDNQETVVAVIASMYDNNSHSINNHFNVTSDGEDDDEKEVTNTENIENVLDEFKRMKQEQQQSKTQQATSEFDNLSRPSSPTSTCKTTCTISNKVNRDTMDNLHEDKHNEHGTNHLVTDSRNHLLTASVVDDGLDTKPKVDEMMEAKRRERDHYVRAVVARHCLRTESRMNQESRNERTSTMTLASTADELMILKRKEKEEQQRGLLKMMKKPPPPSPTLSSKTSPPAQMDSYEKFHSTTNGRGFPRLPLVENEISVGRGCHLRTSPEALEASSFGFHEKAATSNGSKDELFLAKLRERESSVAASLTMGITSGLPKQAPIARSDVASTGKKKEKMDEMAQTKQRERDRGPQLITTMFHRKGSMADATHPSTTFNNNDMEAVKRKEGKRTSGNTASSMMASRSRFAHVQHLPVLESSNGNNPTKILVGDDLSAARSSPTFNSSHVGDVRGDVVGGYAKKMNGETPTISNGKVDEMVEAKRRLREPQLFLKHSIVVPRTRLPMTTSVQEHINNKNDDNVKDVSGKDRISPSTVAIDEIGGIESLPRKLDAPQLRVDDVMEEAKCKERRTGPQLAEGVTVVARKPPSRLSPSLSTSFDNKVVKYSSLHELTAVKSREMGCLNDLAARDAYSKNASSRQVDSETGNHEYGGTRPAAPKAKSNLETLEEIKRREKERRMPENQMAGAVFGTPNPVSSSAHYVGDCKDEITKLKRDAHCGPQLAGTSSAVYIRRQMSISSPTTDSTEKNKDEISELKKREKERVPQLSSARTSSQVTNYVESTHLDHEDFENALNVARTMKIRGELEKVKLSQQDSGPSLATAETPDTRRVYFDCDSMGPSLATATAEDPYLSNYAATVEDLNEKEKPERLILPNEVDGRRRSPVESQRQEQELNEQRILTSYADEFAGEHAFFEVQAGLPVIFPGAFAIEGVDARSDESSDYDSQCDNNSCGSRYNSEDNEILFVDGNPESKLFDIEGDNEALAAELHEELIVDGAVILPQGDDFDTIILDSKTALRIRMVQISVVCFSLAAIILVSFSIVGGFSQSNDSKEKPAMEGWFQIGANVFGPKEVPQAMFGTKIAISGDGNRLAIAAPGIDSGINLNTGSVYIMEEDIGVNGTEWKTIHIINGSVPSQVPEMSLAASEDLSTIAVGYPRVQEGGRVYLYTESSTGSTWQEGSLNLQALSPLNNNTWFGYSVDLSSNGNMLAVGAPLTNMLGKIRVGCVQVFVKMNSTLETWERLGDDIFGKDSNEYFGWSVKIVSSERTNSPRVAVGSPVANGTAGVVRVLELKGTKWIQVGSDLIGGETYQRFGESVSLSSDGATLAVGARGTGLDPGMVKIFRQINTEWIPFPSTTEETNVIPGREPGEGFGTSVILSNDGSVLAVGAPRNSLYGDGTGTVRVYHFDELLKTWSEKGKHMGGEKLNDLGRSISMSSDGRRVAGGAPSTPFAESIPRVGIVKVYDTEQSSV